MIGKTLAHYEITSQIGKGGMGEVFRAKDQKLGRDVAIKVLPEEFAKDTDRVARFQREAKLLASLNHPNIAAIYGLEEAEGTTFLVLELVQGETLSDQLKRGPIAVEESLKLALQIAEALEAAHEKGVIHRDLKPANIKVTPDGKVKVLDFGLAKAYAGDREEVNLSNSPTLSDAATQQGVILGTAGYMSPEQAKGKTVDKRADIWAFGVVMFEMLTGRQLFKGETVSETLAAVLMREPDWKRLPQNLHPRICLVLERCLEKEARDRCHDIADVRVDMQRVLADRGGVFAEPVTTGKSQGPRLGLAWVTAAVIAAAIIASVAVWMLKPVGPQLVTRLYCELPKDRQFSNLSENNLAVSPDGRQIVYSANSGLYLRKMNELDAKLIPGTGSNPQKPFFSPDGKWIAYWSGTENKLKKISVDGGVPVTLTGAGIEGSFNWQADGAILFGEELDIKRISSSGGIPETVIRTKSSMSQSPQILPGGKSVLYETHTGEHKVVVQMMGSGEPKVLLDGSGVRYVPTGHIVYEEGNDLIAVPFDPKKLEVTGGPVPVVEGVYGSDLPQYAISDTGTLVYVPGTATGMGASQRMLVWVDRNGKEEPLSAPPDTYSAPKISPDGTRVALTVGTDKNADIWIYDLARKTPTRLTFDAGRDSDPIWSPDGKRIVFRSSREGRPGVCWRAADGTGSIEKLSSGSLLNTGCFSWAGGAKALVFEVQSSGQTSWDIAALSMKGAREVRPMLQDKFMEVNPQISPDGRWIAYSSNESGKLEVYVRPFPDVNGGKWQVSTNGGANPRWSPDSRELFYRNGDLMMAVAVETKPGFQAGVPRELFRGKYFTTFGIHYDISPDGRRFLMVKSTAPASESSEAENPRRINIVLNWLDELKQRVPK